MLFHDIGLAGAFLIEPERVADHRGFFARTWSDAEFSERGLVTTLRQCSLSFNHRRGTLRGMHFQRAPFGETKVVRCTQGAIFDVLIDLRPGSPTFRRWVGETLSAGNRRMFYIPEGFAHGFQTLQDNCEVFYQISQVYSADHASGVRWDDPAFGIEWPPADERVMSDRDRDYPDFRPR